MLGVQFKIFSLIDDTLPSFTSGNVECNISLSELEEMERWCNPPILIPNNYSTSVNFFSKHKEKFNAIETVNRFLGLEIRSIK